MDVSRATHELVLKFVDTFPTNLESAHLPFLDYLKDEKIPAYHRMNMAINFRLPFVHHIAFWSAFYRKSKSTWAAYGITNVFPGDYEVFFRGEEKDSKEKESDYYHYIPYSRAAFLSSIAAISRKEKKLKTFMDVGCGIGDKLITALLLFQKCVGIEYNKQTSEVGKFFAGLFSQDTIHYKDANKPVEIIQTDAFDYDFSQLRDTLIYMYVPIANPAIMEKLYKKILSEMGPGCVMFDIAQPVPYRRIAREICEKLSYDIYFVKDQAGNLSIKDFYPQ